MWQLRFHRVCRQMLSEIQSPDVIVIKFSAGKIFSLSFFSLPVFVVTMVTDSSTLSQSLIHIACANQSTGNCRAGVFKVEKIIVAITIDKTAEPKVC